MKRLALVIGSMLLLTAVPVMAQMMDDDRGSDRGMMEDPGAAGGPYARPDDFDGMYPGMMGGYGMGPGMMGYGAGTCEPGYGMGPGMMGGYGMGPGMMGGYGMQGGMMGPGMMGGYGHHRWDGGFPMMDDEYGKDFKEYRQKNQKFLDETRSLRKKMHDLQFDYMEALRSPDTSRKELWKMRKDMLELREKIDLKAEKMDE